MKSRTAPHAFRNKPTVKKASSLSYFVWMLLVIVAFVVLLSLYHFSSESIAQDVAPITKLLHRSEEQAIETILQLVHKLDTPSHSYSQAVDLENAESKNGMAVIQPPSMVPTLKPVNIYTKKRLAFVITITKDGFFQDGAAVLSYSIMKFSKSTNYLISFIAFVHPNVTISRPGLRRLGFHVIEVPTPVNTSAIRFPFLRDHIDKNGCCGATELIKLTSYRLLQYHRVVHMDADTMFLNPIDELFDRDYSLIYTTDPNMASHKGIDKMPVQGGFIVMRPSEQDYINLIHIVMNTEFAKGGAWNRSRIGWFWGGMTVQGVLPYYYNRVTEPGRSQIVDRCYYNTMADTDECSTQQLHELKSAHFTVCQKPWGCWQGSYANRLCGELHQRWFELRKEAEAFYNITVNQKACKRGGHKHYQPMKLEEASLPVDRVRDFVVPDDSLDRYTPISEARYIGTTYN